VRSLLEGVVENEARFHFHIAPLGFFYALDFCISRGQRKLTSVRGSYSVRLRLARGMPDSHSALTLKNCFARGALGRCTGATDVFVRDV